ncbi:MAG: hypothetical protein ACRDUB_13635 [Mycobacterium sp.]
MSNEHMPSLNDALRAGPSASYTDPPRMARSGAHSRTRVLVRELADIAYRGRRVQYADITGTVHGVEATAAIAVAPDGQGVAQAGRPRLALIDDAGQDHHLEFGAHDYVTLLD